MSGKKDKGPRGRERGQVSSVNTRHDQASSVNKRQASIYASNRRCRTKALKPQDDGEPQSHGMPMGVADGTADVVWAAGVTLAVVAAAGVPIQRPCTRNGPEIGKEALQTCYRSEQRIEDCFSSENFCVMTHFGATISGYSSI